MAADYYKGGGPGIRYWYEVSGMTADQIAIRYRVDLKQARRMKTYANKKIRKFESEARP